MYIVEPSVSLIGGNVADSGRAKHVELCGRVCYKSEDRITDDSAGKFIAGIIKRGHEAVLEHARATIHVLDRRVAEMILDIRRDMQRAGLYDYLTETYCLGGYVFSGNMRAWRNVAAYAAANEKVVPADVYRMFHRNDVFFPEFINPSLRDSYTLSSGIMQPKHLPVADRIAHSWYTLRFVCDRGISHEIVRHRPASYCQESTRYCNYSKGDFGGQITVIKPFFLEEGTVAYDWWRSACEAAENAYFGMLTIDRTPQEARNVLPTSLKTEIVMTATADEWLHFLRLRTAPTAHPQMREVATQAKGILLAQDEEVFSRV